MSLPIQHLDRPLQIGEAVGAGGRLFRQYLGVWVGSFVLSALLVAVINGIVNSIEKAFQANLLSANGSGGIAVATLTNALIVNPIQWFVGGVVFYVIYRGQLRALDQKSFQFNDLTRGDTPYLRFGMANLLDQFLAGLPALLLSVPMAYAIGNVSTGPKGPSLPDLALVLGPYMAVLAVAYLGLAPFFLLYAYFVIDHPETSLIDCLKFSFAAGRKNYWPLMGLAIVSGLAMAVGVLACGIGLIFTMPWGLCMQAAAYRQLVQPPGSDEEAAREQAWEAADRAQEDAYEDDGSWDERR